MAAKDAETDARSKGLQQRGDREQFLGFGEQTDRVARDGAHRQVQANLTHSIRKDYMVSA